MTKEGTLVALGVCLAGFLVVVVGIVIYMCRKHRKQTASFAALGVELKSIEENNGRLEGDGESELDPTQWTGGGKRRARPNAAGESAAQTRATYIIPQGLKLLKTCKSLAHRLLACAIDGTSHDDSRSLVVGSIDRIVEASKTLSPRVDDLTKCMYPPINADRIKVAATELVAAMENLALLTKRNCDTSKLRWLESATDEVCQNYEDLNSCVERYVASEAVEDIYA